MGPKKIYVDRKGQKNLRRQQQSRKRKHRPLNRHSMEAETASTSSSAKKLKDSNDIDIAVDASFGYRIINFISVFSAISAVVKCKECNGNIKFTEASCRGLGFKLVINCESCVATSVNSSPLINGKAYEINRRITFIFRLLGLGYAALEKFCGFMELPKTFTESMYRKISTNVFEAAEAIGERSMRNAVKEEVDLNDGCTDLTVSGDGTWQKRGFSSLFGVSSLIAHTCGKVLDILVKSSYCKECESWSSYSGTPEYETWKESHAEHCNMNHEGSAGKMEVDAMKEMFQRSEEKHSVRYVNYVGDGDSKTYKAIVESKPYEDVNIIKKECIGHVQKRMGTRLRNVKKQNKGLGGRGKLTDKLINELTIYYGLAIRRNSESKQKMKEAVWATFLHKTSTDDNPQHQWCDSVWCSYLKAKEANTLQDYVHPEPLPKIVQDAIRPIYEDLSDDNLLQRCVGGFNQNSNESLNSVIWSIAPKTKFCGKHTVDFASYLAASLFNDGHCSVVLMMQLMGLTIGPRSQALYLELDERRISKAETRKFESSKLARQMLSAARKQAEASFLETEGELYGAGIAD